MIRFAPRGVVGIVMALAVAISAGIPVPAGAVRMIQIRGDPSGCGPYLELTGKHELSVSRQLKIPPLASWTMPHNPTWRENPFRDIYWLVRYQSLRYVEHLIAEWCRTGEPGPLNRARYLMVDWLHDNPQAAAGPRAWYDHSVAWRTFVLIKATGVMPGQKWLRPAIEAHGAWLAGHSGGVGNHALNTNRGLLAAGCFVGRQDWIDLAVRRIETLLGQSVDEQGVTNEQAVGYQDYNFRMYDEARRELLACGQPLSPTFERIDLMPNMLAFATLPNGEYEMLGNTAPVDAPGIPGTWAEFAATQGASGPKPPSTDAVYRRGFAFIRSGWGERRPYADEVMLTLRYGPGRAFHGHDDGGSMTLYGLGSRLIFDGGKNTFQSSRPWSPFFLSRDAHNVVTVDGLSYARATTTAMISARSDRSALFVLRNDGFEGVANTRSVLYSRRGRYVLVVDRLASLTSQTYRQLWHLADDADPVVAGSRVVTRSPGGNIEIVQLLVGTTRIADGRIDPRQGWLTMDYQEVTPAPTVEEIRTGARADYVTVLVPFRAPVPVSGRVRSLFDDGFEVDVTIDGRTERWTVHGTTVRVRDLTSAPIHGCRDEVGP